MADSGILTEDTLMNLKAGTGLFSRYIIINTIGVGGFGITYKARDTKFDLLCAIKEFVPRDLVTRQDDGKTIVPLAENKQQMYEHGLNRFLEEAEILEKLEYIKEVVSVYDFFKENGTCYMVMEYLEGSTLSRMIKSQKNGLPLSLVTQIMAQAGGALIQIHNQNIFHRDISPDNIIITSTGQVKLIDFGSAKALMRNEMDKLSVVLKPGFAPPEQYSSKVKQGTFTDVYSFACTMYYAITGQRIPEAFDRYGEDLYIRLTAYGYPENMSYAMDMALKLNYKERTQTINEFLNNMGIVPEICNLPQEVLYSSSEEEIENTRYEEIKQAGQMALDSIKTNQVPCLKILSGERADQIFQIPKGAGIVLGRNEEECHVAFSEDFCVSKKHCIVYYDDVKELFYLQDISSNGTYVHDIRLNKEVLYVLKPGTEIQIGKHIVSFTVGMMKP